MQIFAVADLSIRLALVKLNATSYFHSVHTFTVTLGTFQTEAKKDSALSKVMNNLRTLERCSTSC